MDNFEKKNNSDQHKELYDGIKNLSITVAGLPKVLSDDFDNRYASKWAEKAWVWVIAFSSTIVLGAVIGSVVIDKVKAFF